MGSVSIYTGMSNEYQTIKGSGTVRDLALKLNPYFDLKQAIILNAGEKITPDYEVKDNDIIFIRYVPGATVVAVISLVCATVALGAAIYSAVETQKQQEQMEKAQRQARALSERITQLPFLKGANNRSALGYNIPYVMGNVYNVPYKLTSGFYTIEGENGKNQFWNVNFINGFNNAIIQDVSIGNVKIKKSNGSIIVPGTSEQVDVLTDSANNPYFFESDCSYYDPANRLEIKYKDEMAISGLGEKVTATSYGDELDTNEPVIKQLEEHTYKADICIQFDGLRIYKEDEWKSKNITFKIEWSDNGVTWNNTGFFSTGEVNSRKTVRFQKTITFSAGQCVDKDLSIRITRTTALEESNAVETAHLCYINCWQYDATKSTNSNIVICRPLEMPWRERTTRIGLRVIANESTKDCLDQINCNVYGKARTWNGNSWSSEKYPTRNPAAWILEIMTTDIHPHSRYNDDEIDLEALGKVYELCEKEHFYCDGLLTDDTKKRDILNNILAECNSTMYLDHTTGQWTFATEEKQTTPVALLNDQCIKSISVSKSFERKPYAMKTTFTNRDSWAVDTFYQTKDGIIESSQAYGTKKIITETAPKYITTFDHAYKFTRRQIAKQRLQPREIVVSVGREGDYYPLYSKVMLQMKTVGLSNGVIHSVVMEGKQLTKIVTSDLCDFTDTKKRYGIIIQAQNDSGKTHIYAEVTGKGKTRNVSLKTPTACTIVPGYGNSYSFGYLDGKGSFHTITNEMMIYGARQTADGWELTLKDYNNAIFENGAIPQYKTNLTTPKENGSRLPDVTYKQVVDLIDASVIPGKDAITIYSELPSYVFTSDENGEIQETNLDNIVHVQLEGKEMPFRFGDISVPSGFYISTNYHTVKIRGNAGNGMQKEGTINIPVIYHPIEEEIKIGFDDTIISNGATPIGHYTLSSKEIVFNLKFAYAKSIKGDKGSKGESGKGIKTITDYYLASPEKSGIKSEDITSTEIPTLTPELKYLWKTEQITYSDDSKDDKTQPVIIGTYGDKGENGISIKSIKNFYLASSEKTGISKDKITEIKPPLIDSVNKYLWNYEHIVYTDESFDDTLPAVIGVYGDKGSKGDKGQKGDNGESTWFASFDTSSFCFACDSNGIAWGEQVPCKITLLKGENEVPFTIIDVKNNNKEITATIKDDTIIFESVAGAKITESLSIPVTIQYQDYQNIGIGIDTKNIGFNGLSIGYRKYNGKRKTDILYFNYTTVKTGINRGLKNIIDSYLEPTGKHYKGDFFTWGGEKTSIVYSGVTYTFEKGRVYNWNGLQWEESKDDSQLGESFYNVMSVLDDEIVNNNSKLEMTMRKLSSVTIFCEELAAQIAFIKKLFAQDIVLASGGKIRSEVNTDKKGLLLTADGHAELKDAIIYGEIYANKGVFKGNVTAENVSINGFCPGEVLLKSFTFPDGKHGFCEIPIYGTGTARIKVFWQPRNSAYLSAGSFFVTQKKIGGIKVVIANYQSGELNLDSKVTLVSIETNATRNHLYFDCHIDEGDVINITCPDGGGVIGNLLFVTNGGIYTNSNNGILAYLGSVSYNTDINPGR